LLIDDDLMENGFLGDYLQETLSEYEVRTVTSADEALNVGKSEQIVFVVADLMMRAPTKIVHRDRMRNEFLTGLIVIDHLLKTQPKARIAILSGGLRGCNAIDREVRDYCERHPQVVAIWRKPMDADEIAEAIRAHLQEQ